MDEVLKHSATCLFSKSILVKIPRLPTMRVIGSQFISTRFRLLVGVTAPGCKVVAIYFILSTLVGPRPVAGSELEAAMTPLRLFVNCRVGDPAQGANHAAIDADRGGRKHCTGRLVHERHELVRKSRHGAADANSAHVWTTTDTAHP